MQVISKAAAEAVKSTEAGNGYALCLWMPGGILYITHLEACLLLYDTLETYTKVTDKFLAI